MTSFAMVGDMRYLKRRMEQLPVEPFSLDMANNATIESSVRYHRQPNMGRLLEISVWRGRLGSGFNRGICREPERLKRRLTGIHRVGRDDILFPSP